MLLECGLNDFEDFSPLQPGKYNFIIKEPAEVVKADGEQNDLGGQVIKIIVKPEVVGGDHAGKKVRRQLTNRSKASRFFMRSFLEKVGVEVTGSGGFAPENLLGKQFQANVSERMYKDQEGNEKKAAELEEGSIVAI